MSHLKLKPIALAMAVGTAACGFAAGGGQTFSLAPLGNVGGGVAQQAAASATDSGETVKVQGRGVGVDKTAALKDAYRDAIERAVGLYVDAEVAAENDQLVKDQILTQSNAYITDYKEIEEKQLDGGLVQLRILATVKKAALTTKISGVMPTQTFQLGNDGARVHARQVTQEKRGEDAATLLKNALDGINPVKQLVRMSLADTKMIEKDFEDRGNGNGSPKKVYFYKFKFELDTEKYYNEFLPSLLNVLDQISIETPRMVRFSRIDRDRIPRQSYLDERAEKYLSGNWERYSSDGACNESYLELDGAIACDVIALMNTTAAWSLSTQQSGAAGAHYGYNCSFDSRDYGNRYLPIKEGRKPNNSNTKKNSFQVVVITEMNSSKTIAKAKYYNLPAECAETVLDWQWQIVGNPLGNHHYHGSSANGEGVTHYTIVFKDDKGEEVYSKPFTIRNIALINAMAGQGAMFDGSNPSKRDIARIKAMGGQVAQGYYGWYVSPMIHTDALSLQRWIGFDIPLDDLPKIKSVSIELAD